MLRSLAAAALLAATASAQIITVSHVPGHVGIVRLYADCAQTPTTATVTVFVSTCWGDPVTAFDWVPCDPWPAKFTGHDAPFRLSYLVHVPTHNGGSLVIESGSANVGCP